MIKVKGNEPIYTEEEFSMLVEDMNEARVLNDIEEDNDVFDQYKS